MAKKIKVEEELCEGCGDTPVSSIGKKSVREGKFVPFTKKDEDEEELEEDMHEDEDMEELDEVQGRTAGGERKYKLKGNQTVEDVTRFLKLVQTNYK